MGGKYIEMIFHEDNPAFKAVNPTPLIQQTNDFEQEFRRPRERSVYTVAQWLVNHEQSHFGQVDQIVNTVSISTAA